MSDGLRLDLVHPSYQVLQVFPHRQSRQVDALPMAGQNPVEGILKQAGYRFSLLRPRVPAIIRRRVKALRVAIPIQMVAGEEVSIAIEQTAMAPSVSGRGYYQEFGGNRDWIETVDYDLRPRLTVYLVLMNDSFTSKVSGKLYSIGNVIPMAQKDVAQPA
jgi:hypothetical protein